MNNYLWEQFVEFVNEKPSSEEVGNSGPVEDFAETIGKSYIDLACKEFVGIRGNWVVEVENFWGSLNDAAVEIDRHLDEEFPNMEEIRFTTYGDYQDALRYATISGYLRSLKERQ